MPKNASMKPMARLSLDSFWQRKKVFFDIGSSNTRVGIDGAIIFNAPTCIAVHKQTKAVLAIGTQAAALLGKTPDTIEVVFPIKGGSVASEELVTVYIETLMKQIVPSDLATSLIGFTGAAIVPTQISPVDNAVWKRVFSKAGFVSMTLVKNVEGLYAYIAGPDILAHSICVIDIGGQKMDIGVISAGEIVKATTVYLGGVECTHIVQDVLYEKEMIVAGWQSAEACKKEVGLVGRSTKEKKTTLRGKDSQKHVAKTITVNSTLFTQELNRYADLIVQEMIEFFSQMSSELAATTFDKGIYVTGGGSLLQGLCAYIQTELKTEVIMIPPTESPSLKGLMMRS